MLVKLHYLNKRNIRGNGWVYNPIEQRTYNTNGQLSMIHKEFIKSLFTYDNQGRVLYQIDSSYSSMNDTIFKYVYNSNYTLLIHGDYRDSIVYSNNKVTADYSYSIYDNSFNRVRYYFYDTDNYLDSISYYVKSSSTLAKSVSVYFYWENYTPNTSSTYSIVKNKFTVYPNPANEIINLTGSVLVNNWKITNINGQIVENGFANNENDSIQQISISSLEIGFYYLTIELNDGTVENHKISILR